jgi:hypothetical protein
LKAAVMLDPVTNTAKALAVPNLIGHHTLLNGVQRFQMQSWVGNDQENLIIVQWSPISTRAVVVARDSDTADSFPLRFEDVETLEMGPITALRPSRLSVSIRNVTKADNVAGSIRVVMVDEQLMWDLQSDLEGKCHMFWKCLSLANNDQRSRAFSAHELTNTHRFMAAPNSMKGMSNALPYSNRAGAQSIGETDRRILGLRAGAFARGLQTIIIRVPWSTAETVQTYDIAIHSQDAAIFPANSLGAALRVPDAHMSSLGYVISAVNDTNRFVGAAVGNIDSAVAPSNMQRSGPSSMF